MDTQIRAILQRRIDQHKKSVGIVVGMISDQGSQVIGYGRLNRGSDRKPDGDTVFEIGSVTKVFTTTLLADMVEHGELGLDDPIANFLLQPVKVPTRKEKQIALRHLATHTSGLPRLPTNFAPKDWSNPYADYTVEQMYAFLSSYRLPRDVGAKYEYSNLGGGMRDLEVALGWHIFNKYGTQIVWHNGGTGGYRSFIGFDKKKNVGVVVLSNSANDVEDIGLHLLESRYPLHKR